MHEAFKDAREQCERRIRAAIDDYDRTGISEVMRRIRIALARFQMEAARNFRLTALRAIEGLELPAMPVRESDDDEPDGTKVIINVPQNLNPADVFEALKDAMRRSPPAEPVS